MSGHGAFGYGALRLKSTTYRRKGHFVGLLGQVHESIHGFSNASSRNAFFCRTCVATSFALSVTKAERSGFHPRIEHC